MKHIAWLACGLVTSAGLVCGMLGGCGSDDATVTDNGDGGGSSGGSSSGAASSSGGSSSGSTSSSSGSSGNPEGGPDGSSSGSVPEGGTPSNPNKVTCGSAECNGATPVCCYTFSGGGMGGGGTVDAGCTAANDCNNGLPVACDEKADCTDGGVCCLGFTGSECRGSCGGTRVQVCKSSTECVDGGTCQVYTCQGRTVEACEKPLGCN